MKAAALLAAALLAAGSALAQPYGRHDPQKVLVPGDASRGKPARLDLVALDAILSDLSLHARNFPPRFDSAEDRRRAERDTAVLLEILETVVPDPQLEADILLRTAFLHNIGHHFRFAGAAAKAEARYRRVLAIAPDHPRATLFYGAFLADAGRFRESVPYLERAERQGSVDAVWALGIAWLRLGDRSRALGYLEAYRRRVPGDANAAALIEAVRAGRAPTSPRPP
jgi:tetratricopeptide (TPR) repeat protein